MPCPCCGGTTLDVVDIKLSNGCVGVGWSDNIARLSPMQFNIARELVQKAPGYVSGERLLSLTGSTTHVLKSQISYVRRMLAPLDLIVPDAGPHTGYTICRAGYRIMPELSRRNISMTAARVRAVADMRSADG